MVGPSASGKSTLARLLVGLWPTLGGKVRLDGVDVYAWNKQELGPHVGYLPQDNELFDGTLAENIARFGDVDRAKVEAAARAVGLHEIDRRAAGRLRHARSAAAAASSRAASASASRWRARSTTIRSSSSSTSPTPASTRPAIARCCRRC